jgi:Cdc6-like AAA superfamily ATPase
MSFDVFLSHNSHDKPSVRELGELLKKRGLTVWLDEWELVPGRPWQEALEDVIVTTRSAAVLVGSEGIGPWQTPEMRAALSQFVEKGLPVIPVLLPNAPSRVDLPLFLQNFTWVDFRGGFSSDHIDRLIWGITGNKPGEKPKTKSANQRAYRSSTVRPKLEQVFKTVGLPRFTYVEPTIYRKFSHAVRIPGKHIVLEGPSGVGKTCLVFRVFEELGFERHRDYQYLSARQDNSEEQLLTLLHSVSGDPAYIVIDDVHIFSPPIRRDLSNHLKLMSDGVFTDESVAKCILIGIPTASSGLLYDAIDLGPRLITFNLSIATHQQIQEVIHQGEERLAVRFPDRDVIVNESNGSFYLCQFICHEICFSENVFEAGDDTIVLRYRIEDVRQELQNDLGSRYNQHIYRFCKGGATKVDNASGHIALLASIARIPKAVIHQNEILIEAGKYGPVALKALASMCDPEKGPEAKSALSNLLHYDETIETFSIEDPAFRYYLNVLDIRGVFETLGLHDEAFIAHFSRPSSSRIDEAKQDTSAGKGPKKTDSHRDLVFISYAHADAKWMERLSTHLKPLVKQGDISLWSDTQIRAGTNWMEEIDRAISSAKVVVLLVSAHYLASNFIIEKELPALLKQAQTEGVRIFWMPVSHCLWQSSPIAHYQAAIDPFKPLETLTLAQRDKVLMEVSTRIMMALDV